MSHLGESSIGLNHGNNAFARDAGENSITVQPYPLLDFDSLSSAECKDKVTYSVTYHTNMRSHYKILPLFLMNDIVMLSSNRSSSFHCSLSQFREGYSLTPTTSLATAVGSLPEPLHAHHSPVLVSLQASVNLRPKSHTRHQRVAQELAPNRESLYQGRVIF